MSRPSQLKSRKRANGTYYYCVYRGKQHGLGYDYQEARRAYARIVGDLPRESHDSVTIGELASWFDEWSMKFTSNATAKDYGFWLSRFVSHVGPELPAMDLRPKHVDAFAVHMGHVGDWSHVKIVRAVKRLYRWSKDQGHLAYQSSPLAGLKGPPKPESPQVVLSPRQVAFAWRSCSRDFRPILRFYYHTGCRPEEAPKLLCTWVDTSARMVTIPASLSKKKITRHIPYPPKLDRMIQRCIKRSKTGRLFENRKGQPFTRWAVDTRHDRIRRRKLLLYPDGLYARLWRYSFATRAIKGGMDIVTLSHVLGHKDLTMLRQHYEKIGADRAHLVNAVDRISRGRR